MRSDSESKGGDFLAKEITVRHELMTEASVLEATLEKAKSMTGSFCVLLCVDSENAARRYRDALIAQLADIPDFVLADTAMDTPMEQSICLNTTDYDSLLANPTLLLDADLTVCIANDLSDRERYVKALQYLGGYALLASEQIDLWQHLRFETYGKDGVYEFGKLSRVLHGMVLYEGGKLRRKSRRQAVKLCLAAQKFELSKRIQLRQKRHTVRQDVAKIHFRKFIHHWNDLDNMLADGGDYPKLLQELLYRCENPLTFQKDATALLHSESKAYFIRMGLKFTHSIPRSAACNGIKDDFYRIVLDYKALQPVRCGEKPKRWWNTVFGIAPKPIYNDYREQTLAHWQNELLPALRRCLRHLLAAYEEEYRAQTAYPDLEPYASEYVKRIEIEQHLDWEEYL